MQDIDKGNKNIQKKYSKNGKKVYCNRRKFKWFSKSSYLQQVSCNANWMKESGLIFWDLGNSFPKVVKRRTQRSRSLINLKVKIKIASELIDRLKSRLYI